MNFHSFKANDITGKELDLSVFKGKKVLLINVASDCGFTPQYEQMEELYEAFKDKNFTIVGFPANDFGEQESGTDAEIAAFCKKNYGVTFPMMSKIHVVGEQIHPLYKWVTEKIGRDIRWNFHKVLIDENGEVVRDVSPSISPVDETILQWLES